MKIINRKKSIKLALIMSALTLSLFAVQCAKVFVHDYRILVIEKRDGSWATIAEAAQGELSACNKDLELAKEGKQAAMRAANEDLYQ